MIVLDANNKRVERCHLMVTLVVVRVRCSLVDVCRHDGHGLNPVAALMTLMVPSMVDGDGRDGASLLMM